MATMKYIMGVLILGVFALGCNTKEYFVVKNLTNGKDLYLYKSEKGIRFCEPIDEPRVPSKSVRLDTVDYSTYNDSIYIVDNYLLFYKLHLSLEVANNTVTPQLVDTTINGIPFQYYYNPEPLGYDSAGEEFRYYSLIVREYEGVPVYHHFVVKWMYYVPPSDIIWEMLAKAKLE